MEGKNCRYFYNLLYLLSKNKVDSNNFIYLLIFGSAGSAVGVGFLSYGEREPHASCGAGVSLCGLLLQRRLWASVAAAPGL